jgi:transcriptional regulator with XRE-family HTH domain
MKSKKVHLGHKLKRIRSMQGISQEELAKAIGKTRSLISHLEITGNINKYTLQEIANVLNVDIATIEDFNFEGINAVVKDKNESYLTGKDEIQKLKEEIKELKATIKEQWKIIQHFTNAKK